MKPSIKRLAKDQIALRRSLPPNYFFEDAEAGQSLPDDLTQLAICLTGADGTPYVQGVWHIRLDIPLQYPQSAPTATFKTRIFHPNVAEETGAVCLETLKRDWRPDLTLKDILVTISCLLIQPNPDSALNQKAGALIQDDYEAFARQARLMTRIHAPIPPHFVDLANSARARGDEESEHSHLQRPLKSMSSADSSKPMVHHKNQQSSTTAVMTPGNRSQKRAIDQLFPAESPLPNLQDIDTRHRKSPKHEPSVGDGINALSQNIILPQSEEVMDMIHASISLPEKIVFRPQWISSSSGLRPRARIGIRRL